MLIYEKNEENNSIKVYTMEARKEELKKFKKRILRKYSDPLFYHLKTNDDSTLNKIDTSLDIESKFLNYNYSRSWSQLATMESRNQDVEKQKEILIKYVNGAYDFLLPVRVYDEEVDICRLLKVEDVNVIGSNYTGVLCEIRNMLNLPRELYLLQLLQTERFDRLVEEDIEEQLKLFRYNYLRSVSIMDIKNMLETGLVSGTVENAIDKVETCSKILEKLPI